MIERMLAAGLHFLQGDPDDDPATAVLWAVLDHQEAHFPYKHVYKLYEGTFIRMTQVAFGAGLALGVHMERQRRKA